ncbi:hypothetical protein FHEFKHOI_01687 [Candidatus Methanoperedenaceae archaeon GB50]|nr:hypothetical protein AIOGIFDO_01678 [Candidatus Methanoperedenaceae archaeon GB37]CAD7775002.1 hypothetical protein FHEFKHOI_01687 [Candidatus Methanoperedenaceae archaeon GB50]
MVSKTVTQASMLMPVAMVVGTSMAIIAYSHSQVALSVTTVICTVLLTLLLIRVAISHPVRRL